MDFSLSEEQQAIRELAAKIFKEQCSAEALTALEKANQHFDEALWQALAEAGLLGIALPEALGGMGYDFESLCVLLEEAGRTVPKLPLIETLVGVAGPLCALAPVEVQQGLLSGLASGDTLPVIALNEPGADNPAEPETRLSGGGEEFTLSGTKHSVVQADRADWFLVSAGSDNGPAVVAVPAKTAGIELTPQYVTSGERRFAVSFQEVSIEASMVLARGGAAEAWLHHTQQHLQAAYCRYALGLCDSMMRMSAGYTSEREQFGRAVATFQAVSHRVADCYIDVECLRLVTDQAVALLNKPGDSSAEAIEEAVNVAKIWCGDVCHRVSQSAQHVHGGIGVDRDYPLHRYCLMARQIELSAGTRPALLAGLGQKIAAAV